MSYILEAIKKSEQEREHGSVPHLRSVHYFSDSNVKKSYFPWLRIIVVVLIINAGVLVWIMMPDFSDEEKIISTQPELAGKKELTESRQISPEITKSEPDVVKQTKSAGVAEITRPISPIIPVSPTITSNVAVDVDNDVPVKASIESAQKDFKVPIDSETPENLEGVTVSNNTSDQPEQSISSDKKELDVSSSDEKNIPISKNPINLEGVTTVSNATSDEPEQLGSIERIPDVDSLDEIDIPVSKEESNTAAMNNAVAKPEIKKEKIVATPAVTKVVPQETQPPVTVEIKKKKAVKIDLTKVNDAKKGAVTTEQPVPHLVDLPDSVKKSVPNLKYSGHVYSSVPGHRKVIINGNDIREGDWIADDLLLEEITPGGAILQFKELRFRIDLLKDWSFK